MVCRLVGCCLGRLSQINVGTRAHRSNHAASWQQDERAKPSQSWKPSSLGFEPKPGLELSQPVSNAQSILNLGSKSSMKPIHSFVWDLSARCPILQTGLAGCSSSLGASGTRWIPREKKHSTELGG